MQRLRFAVVLSVLLVASGLGFGPGDTAQAASPCDGHQYLDGVGWVCPVPGGLWRLANDDSGRLTHGVDAPDPGTAGAAPFVAPADPVQCTAGGPGVHYHHVIYARASDRPDRYATMKSSIQTWIERANGLMGLEAETFGFDIEYRVLCTGGAITVSNAVLPTSHNADSFSTIVTDLEAQGYDDANVKYMIWYDDTAEGCYGIGHIYGDDKPTADNLNNAGPGAQPLFGVTWGGCTGDTAVRVMMHENGHNMGAVQNSSPNSSGALHCNDGMDIMCYADGGPSSSYSTTVCIDRHHFDCNNNDYFHPNPPSGSYLDLKWNLASAVNRFLVHTVIPGFPELREFSCAPAPSAHDEEISCDFRADDDTDLYYELDWGDGSPVERIPASGRVTANVTQTRTHTYSTVGNYQLALTVHDDESPSNQVTFDLVHQVINPIPTVTLGACSPSPGWYGDPSTCPIRADDNSDSGYFMIDWGDGGPEERYPSSGTVAFGITYELSHTWQTRGNKIITVRATDTGSPPATSAATSRVHTVQDETDLCSFDRTGTLLVGMPGPAVAGVNGAWEYGLGDGCGGKDYRLNRLNGGVAAWRVCWYIGTHEITCHSSVLDVRGIIPGGADRALIQAEAGVRPAYHFFLDE